MVQVCLFEPEEDDQDLGSSAASEPPRARILRLVTLDRPVTEVQLRA